MRDMTNREAYAVLNDMCSEAYEIDVANRESELSIAMDKAEYALGIADLVWQWKDAERDGRLIIAKFRCGTPVYFVDGAIYAGRVEAYDDYHRICVRVDDQPDGVVWISENGVFATKDEAKAYFKQVEERNEPVSFVRGADYYRRIVEQNTKKGMRAE